MPGVIRFLGLVAAAGMALTPLAAAAATPSPSPSLDTILAKPPAGYTELTSSPFHGEFTASQYASQGTDASKRSQVEATLNREGFVDGYGNTWVSTAAGHVLIEVTIAFTGGRGARNWLTAAEAGDKSDASYSHPDTMSGIDPYYGEHVFDKSNNTAADAFSFVKGNDVFLVLVASGSDNNLALAMSQTTAQFGAAPDSTIPSSQWPENAQSPSSAASTAGSVFVVLIVAVLVLGVIGVAVGLILRSRRRTPAFAQAYAPAPTAAVQMSPDGNFWFDGQTWRDAATEVPPGAQRSSDGTLWWDGRNWRPVAPSGPPPQAPPAG